MKELESATDDSNSEAMQYLECNMKVCLDNHPQILEQLAPLLTEFYDALPETEQQKSVRYAKQSVKDVRSSSIIQSQGNGNHISM